MECYGAGTGEEVGERTYKNEKLGMASRGGTIHYTTIDEMYGMLEKTGFRDIQIDTMRYTFCGNLTDMIIENCKKRLKNYETLFDYSRSRCKS